MKKWLRVCLQTVCHQFCFMRCSEVIVSFCEVIPTNTKTLVCSTSVSVMKACFSSRQSSSDLACFVRFEKVNVYTTSNYREKFKAPTSFCFVLKVSHSLWTVSCLQGCTHFFFLLVWCAKVTEGWICWWTQQFPCVKDSSWDANFTLLKWLQNQKQSLESMQSAKKKRKDNNWRSQLYVKVKTSLKERT